MKVKTTGAVAKLEARIAQLEENWKRALADYANLEKRIEKQKSSLAFFLKGEVILSFLKVFEDLKRSQLILKDKGLGLILDELRSNLQKQGVEEIVTEGKMFDPTKMEAVETIKGKHKGRVVRTVESGFLLDDSVLKPAKVVVEG